MTNRMGSGGFSVYGFCRVLGAVSLLALAGCGGGTTTDASVPVTQAARDTGTFPNLNIKPQVAAAQFTDSERTAKLAQLNAEKQRAQAKSGATTEKADAVALRKLGANHAGDTLKTIESGQSEGPCDPALDPTCK